MAITYRRIKRPFDGNFCIRLYSSAKKPIVPIQTPAFQMRKNAKTTDDKSCVAVEKGKLQS